LYLFSHHLEWEAFDRIDPIPESEKIEYRIPEFPLYLPEESKGRIERRMESIHSSDIHHIEFVPAVAIVPTRFFDEMECEWFGEIGDLFFSMTEIVFE
jgi:hypothetical protein